MTAKDDENTNHSVLRRKRGGLKKEDRAIRKALFACSARLRSDLQVEIGRLATLHEEAKAELLRLEALRDATGAALKAARDADLDLGGTARIWPWLLPDSLGKGEAALMACRNVPGDAAPPDVAVD
ncbi:hypothetical protein AAFN86_16055 [Roseomonas sp. CAU 1739]|uniref:hypothetical protein n=1 Tax=Roseomonas sp. CAU 1739 TaxID=3140364 RepID=UPI00325BBD50